LSHSSLRIAWLFHLAFVYAMTLVVNIMFMSALLRFAHGEMFRPDEVSRRMAEHVKTFKNLFGGKQ
jgi:hypothetical protein